MEVYFKELISKEASLEQLVDDLERVVQGADDLAKSIGVDIADAPRNPVAQRLQTLKARCETMKQRLLARAEETDRLVRRNPYSFLFAATVLGMVVGFRLASRRPSLTSAETTF